MTDPPPDAPRPRPSPGARPRPQPRQAPAAPSAPPATVAPSAPPATVAPPAPPAPVAPPAPAGPPEAGPAAAKAPEASSERVPTRRARRLAERDAVRQIWWRRLAVLIVGGCVIAALATSVIVLSLGRDQGGSSSGGSATAGSSAPAAVGSGARLDDPDSAVAFLSGAASDVAAVTNYDYRSLDAALSTGLAVTTGSYRSAYQQAITGTLGATARLRHVVQNFVILRLGIGTMNAARTQAKVLVFGQQEVTDDTTPTTPRTTLVTLCATMVRSGQQYLISDLTADATAGLPPGTRDLAAAAQAAGEEVAAMLSYRRADFEADLAQALSGASNPLRASLQQNGPALRTQVTAGGYDLAGTVSAFAIEQADGTTVTMLIAADQSRLNASGVAQAVTVLRYEVTVVQVGGRWLVSQATSVADG